MHNPHSQEPLPLSANEVCIFLKRMTLAVITNWGLLLQRVILYPFKFSKLLCVIGSSYLSAVIFHLPLTW